MQFRFCRKILGICAGVFFLASACGMDVSWFVIWNTGDVDEAFQNGFVLVIGTPSTVPLESVTLVEGEIPPGMEIQGDGTVQGIPTAAGRFDFTLELTEVGGRQLRRSYGVEVEPPENIGSTSNF